MTKPAPAKGTRDFSAVEIKKREYIFNIIKQVYQKFGFEPLETPAIENIETLTEKYGEEGDQLLFRILRSGNFLSKYNDVLSEDKLIPLRNSIVDKGLRYDLTIPFARYVAKHHSTIGLPYKRYQMQPVWRADRPAKGRYREFYQCDGDVVGTSSLIADAEFVYIVNEVFSKLNLPKAITRINNRKVLYGIAENHNFISKFVDFTTAIDKLDKIGIDGVSTELSNRGFSEQEISDIKIYLEFEGSNAEKLDFLSSQFTQSETGQVGINELRELFSYLDETELNHSKIVFDLTLARGLSYYTGSIYEVVLDGVNMGSVASGGRYNDLTGAFGLKDVPGVGLSFGAERIYDVMENLNLFPNFPPSSLKVLICATDASLKSQAFALCRALRNKDIASDFYADGGKMAKQLKFADRKKIPFVIILGEDEINSKTYTLKNLESGKQDQLSFDKVVETLQDEQI